MTQDDKQLLLKDLCARLPYGVNLHIEFYNLQGDGELASRDVKLTIGNICYCFDNSHWVNFKPYLRPMSSMTEDERKELSIILNYEFYADDDFALVAEDDRHRIRLELCDGYIDWLVSHHFDYRGLIPMGLALEAKEGMYKTE